MKKVCLFLIVFFGWIQLANAASISVTASSNSVTAGGRVTFYVNIRDAGAWQLFGGGTGATSNCSLGEQGVGDTGTGRNGNKTLSVTCTASAVGQINFSISGNVTDAGSGKSVDVSGRKLVTVQAPREKDANNYLKSFSVSGYSITPNFQKDTLEYSVTVPSTVDKVKIEAAAESNYANVMGTGEIEVDEGINVREIKVMSETGVERVYKLTIQVKDENPIEITIDGKKYTILKNIKNVKKPELYENTTIKIQDFEVPAFISETTGYTLVSVKDELGNPFYAIYDSNTEQYHLYVEHKSNVLLLYLMDLPDVLSGYQRVSLEIEGVVYPAYQVSADSRFAIVYAMNIQTGKSTYYAYDKVEHIFQIYDDEMIRNLLEEKENYKLVLIGFAVLSIFLFLLCIYAFLKKPRQNKSKKTMQETHSLLKQEEDFASFDQDIKEEKKENVSSDTEVLEVKDALEKMNDVEAMILEYEKTMALPKSELRKVREAKQDTHKESNEQPVTEEKKKRKKRKTKKD